MPGTDAGIEWMSKAAGGPKALLFNGIGATIGAARRALRSVARRTLPWCGKQG